MPNAIAPLARIAAEQATVYRGGGRRWFTRKAAERAEARKAWKTRCECEEGNPAERYPGYVCDIHSDPVKYARRISLYVAMFVRPACKVAACFAVMLIAGAVWCVVDSPDAMAATGQPNKLDELSGELIAFIAIVAGAAVWGGFMLIERFVDRFVANTTDIYPDGESK